jgi:hypothetical protein
MRNVAKKLSWIGIVALFVAMGCTERLAIKFHSARLSGMFASLEGKRSQFDRAATLNCLLRDHAERAKEWTAAERERLVLAGLPYFEYSGFRSNDQALRDLLEKFVEESTIPKQAKVARALLTQEQSGKPNFYAARLLKEIYDLQNRKYVFRLTSR